MTCKHCGAPITAGMKFCENCGNKVEIEETVSKVEETIERVQPEEVEVQEPVRTYSEQSASSNEAPKPAPEVKPASTGNGNQGFAIASMVCGIISILCCCCSGLGFITAVAALVLGIIAVNKQYDGKGMAIAGIVCGGIGLLIFILAMISRFTTNSLFNSYGSSIPGGIESIDDLTEELEDIFGDL